MPFDIGWEEMVMILFVVLLVFGPGRLPEFGRTLGRILREVRKATDEIRQPLNELLYEDLQTAPPPPPAGPPENICPACGARNISEKTECGLCGTALNPPALQNRAAAAPADGEAPAGAETSGAPAPGADGGRPA
jgi:sec-independent protein translocase protein TatA